MNRTGAILCLLLAGCVSNEQDGLKRIRPGTWIEAKGRVVNGRPIVDEIDELERTDSDKKEKVEITAAATPKGKGELEVIGLLLKADAETEYENDQKELIDPYDPVAGEWVRAKLRNKDGEYKLRTLRKSEVREQFKVVGELDSISAADFELSVGGIRMPYQQGVSVGALGDRASDDPLALFKADDQKGVPFSVRASENLFLGGSGTLEYTDEEEYDLDRTTERDQVSTGATANLDALWLFDDKASYAIFEAGFGRSDTYQDSPTRPDRTNESAQINRAAVSLAVAPRVQVLVGRTDFEDEKEWLFDRTLDGFRGIYDDGDWRFDVGAAVGRDIGSQPNNTENTQLYITMLRYRMTPDWWIGSYVLGRDDQTVLDHEPLLVGLRSIDDPKTGFGHWAELGMARGHTRWGNNPGGPPGGPSNSAVLDDRQDIDGWCFDLLAKYTFDNDYRPCFVLGYAYGSGEKDSNSSQGYRQSGYQDNNAKIGGVTSFRYYGDVFRPELANVVVTTAAASIRPLPNTSLTAVYHTYLQDFAGQDVPITDLRVGSGSVPNGRDADLGWEIDLVFGYRANLFTVEFLFGRFEPGPGFDAQDPTTKFDVTARISF